MTGPALRCGQRLACLLAALALLAGCKPAAPESTAYSMPPAASEPAEPAEPSDVPLVQAAPGSPEEVIALRRLKAYRKWINIRLGGDTVVHVLQARHDLAPVTGDNRTLLVYSSRGARYDCSACVPVSSFFEFRHDPASGRPRLVMASIAAFQNGYGGETLQHRLVALGQRRYAVVFHGDTYGQGVYSELAVLTPVGGRMREVFGALIGASQSWPIGEPVRELAEVEWQAYYGLRPGPGPYLDLHLERRFLHGRRALLDPRHGPLADELTADGRVPNYLVYRFDGSRFRLVAADWRQPRRHHGGWWDSEHH